MVQTRSECRCGKKIETANSSSSHRVQEMGAKNKTRRGGQRFRRSYYIASNITSARFESCSEHQSLAFFLNGPEISVG